MENLCNNCIHKDVCSRWTATWGMKSCENFREGRKGKAIPLSPLDEPPIHMDSMCPFCRASMLETDKFCPMCGADMRN
jgi:hypothetical protein